MMKLDPYLNVDPGTMSPYQHGEVYVTKDGGETDLDLGHYERFLDREILKKNSFSAGQVYAEVLKKERRGDYLGGTVQVIPHVTDEIKSWIKNATKDVDIALIEIGGTVGDIESLPFLEAIRQLRIELGHKNTLFMHLTLVPYLPKVGEIKTKPTQHSVKELLSIGIQPDILICRSSVEIPLQDKKKIALFTNVEEKGVIALPDLDSIYRIPIHLHEEGLDDLVMEKLGLTVEKKADISQWTFALHSLAHPKGEITVAMIGKYMHLTDSYKSLIESLVHASIHAQTKVNILYLEAQTLEDEGTACLEKADAIIVPGGFGERGMKGKMLAIEYARTHKIPYLGICLGMQLALIEYARNVLGIKEANSTEFNAESPYPLIAMITEWKDREGRLEQRHENVGKGGTMRLGEQACHLTKDSKVRAIYGEDTIHERHRHRYEVNNYLLPDIEQGGVKVSGRSVDNRLVEMIELPEHPWFIACQFHPEFTSTIKRGHPLFLDFVKTALKLKQ
jgi:CTP synthase